MIVKLALVILVAVVVLTLVRRLLPTLKRFWQNWRNRILPLLMSPFGFSIAKRVLWIIMRLILRR